MPRFCFLSGGTGRGPFLTHTVRVPDSAAGARLDRFLAELPEVGSRSAAERLLAGGVVRVDGQLRAKSHRLEGGEEVELEPPEPAAPAIEAEDVPFRLAYEDEHCSSSTSRPGSSCTPERSTRAARSSRGRRQAAGGEETGRGSCKA